jgi:hypothetical protein
MKSCKKRRIIRYIKRRRTEEFAKTFGLFKREIFPDVLKNEILTEIRTNFKLEVRDSLFLDMFYEEVVNPTQKAKTEGFFTKNDYSNIKWIVTWLTTISITILGLWASKHK